MSRERRRLFRSQLPKLNRACGARETNPREDQAFELACILSYSGANVIFASFPLLPYSIQTPQRTVNWNQTENFDPLFRETLSSIGWSFDVPFLAFKWMDLQCVRFNKNLFALEGRSTPPLVLWLNTKVLDHFEYGTIFVQNCKLVDRKCLKFIVVKHLWIYLTIMYKNF